MRTHNRQLVHTLMHSVIFWIFAFQSYAFFRYFGLEQASLVPGVQEVEKVILVSPYSIALYIGLGLGVLYGIVDFFYEKYFLKKLGLGLGLVVNTFLHFAAIIFVFTASLTVISKIFSVGIQLEAGWWFHQKRFWAVIWYVLLCSVVASFIKIARERFGAGTFIKMLLGTYKIPKEEQRIFMFLDLKDATGIAEKLGHHLYSQFLQDCFFDLNEILRAYDAEIYQYVGDEAVLSWNYDRGLNRQNCVSIFFAFNKKRENRLSYYLQKYGVFPEFKAGLHGGSVMVAEVGFVKKELAYHGDVLNTCARIQAACNTHQVSLLISEQLLHELQSTSSTVIDADYLGAVLLKGKNNRVKIHAIQRNF